MSIIENFQRLRIFVHYPNFNAKIFIQEKNQNILGLSQRIEALNRLLQ